MGWQGSRGKAPNAYVILAVMTSVLTALIWPHAPAVAAPPAQEGRIINGGSLDDDSQPVLGGDAYARVVARLRAPVSPQEERGNDPDYLRRARVFLAAGDYRRALDACLFHLWARPSVESYVYLTYVYHAIDGYLEHLAAHDRWMAVEHVFLNLAARGASDLIDPPDALARMAKEIMHTALQKQADVTSAMAARLDRESVNRLWKEQSAWRAAQPDDWWTGVPDAWGW